MSTNICFLCETDQDLIIGNTFSLYAMVGLGPISRTYAMIVAREHVKSLADLAKSDATAVGQLVDIRRRLEFQWGPLLLTEHGRVPVCREDGDNHEKHCFHAHALVFSCPASEIIEQASSFYGRILVFPNLEAALSHAAECESYMLVSGSQSDFAVMSRPLNAPRQLARTLVSIKCGEPENADWRSAPRREEAVTMAKALKAGLLAGK